MFRLLLIYLFLLTVAVASGQHPYFYSINDDNGLPSNEVFYLFQDSASFVWIGTNEGLYRYDGTDFIGFSCEQQSGKAISHLQTDRQGKLWCQNFNGQIFSIGPDSLVLEHNWNSRRSNYPDFAFDEGNNVWITADSGLNAFNHQREHQHIASEALNGYAAKSELNDILSFDQRVYYVEKQALGYIEDGKVTRLVHTDKPLRWGELLDYSCYYAVDGKLLLLSRLGITNAIWEVRNDSIIWQRDLPSSLGRVFSLHDDGQGKLWVGGSLGVLCLNYGLQPLFNGQLHFPGKSVSDVLLDKEGNYWFSTLQDGIFIVPSTNIWVYTQENSPLADTRIRQLETDTLGNLYIGYQNGMLSRYNIATQHIATMGFPNSTDEIQALYFDRETGQLIVAQRRTWLVDATSLNATFLQGVSNVKAITKLSPNEYLMGVTVGGFKVKLKENEAQIDLLRDKRASSVFYEQSVEKKWICYVDGLWVETATGQTEVTLNGQPIYGTGIAQTNNGTVWVSTTSHGVLGYKDGKLEIVLNEEIGISKGFARTVAAHGNTLWIVGGQSLISYNVVTAQYKPYNRFDGLPSLEITDIAFLGERILLATPKGLVTIPASFESENTVAPSIFISGFAIHERDTTLVPEYTLPFDDNNIHIRFKGIAFRSHGEFVYKYRLVGLDTTWITTNSSSNFARYQSLPAGRYTFEVIALNEDGMPSTKASTLNIIILKPYWQQWWFYVLCGVGLVGLVSAIFSWRFRTLRRRNELDKRMANSQLTALKSQMNPHFMFNALNSIQDLVLQQDTENAQLYLGKFSELTRKVLEASGKEFIALDKEVEMLNLYLDLEKLRFGNELQYELSVGPQIDMDETQIPSMIIQPFIENALKHGLLHKQGEKQLSISFTQQGNALICTIDDNGVGRKASAEINARKKKHQSFATQATNERLRLLNEFYKLHIELEIIDKEVGTMVVVRIPSQ